MPNLDASPPSIEQIGFFSTIERLRRRMVLLQREVDRHCEEDTTDIYVISVDDVTRLRSKYDKTWFNQCMYSPAVKASVARRLLDAVNGYEFIIDVSVWNKLAGGSK